MKPFLKWVGGKTQILDDVIATIPAEMQNYHELFLGGGSVLLAVLSLQEENKIIIHDKIYAYDLNADLINVYRNIQTNKDILFTHIEHYISEYDGLTGNVINRKPKTLIEAKTSKESYYYWLRNKYNNIDKELVECSALFMFLNKTGFRGMYRIGPNGLNIPYGHYKKTPTIITRTELDAVSKLIQPVEFICCGCNESIQRAKEGDYVYLDPPYAPETENSFVGYTAEGFNLAAHNKLFSDIVALNNKKIKFTLSNAKVDLVTDYFKDFTINDIMARRSINAKKPGSKTMEVLINN